MDQRKVTMFVGLDHYRAHALEVLRNDPNNTYWKGVLEQIDNAKALLEASDLYPKYKRI